MHVDAAGTDLLRHLPQTVLNMTAQHAHLFQTDQGVGAKDPDGDILLALPLLPGLNQLRIIQDETGTPLPFQAPGGTLLLVRRTVKLQKLFPCGQIQNSRGEGRLSVERLGVIAEGKQVQKHLHVSSVPDIRKAEFFPARFIVHHAKPQTVAVNPSVHAVRNPGEAEAFLLCAGLLRAVV